MEKAIAILPMMPENDQDRRSKRAHPYDGYDYNYDEEDDYEVTEEEAEYWLPRIIKLVEKKVQMYGTQDALPLSTFHIGSTSSTVTAKLRKTKQFTRRPMEKKKKKKMQERKPIVSNQSYKKQKGHAAMAAFSCYVQAAGKVVTKSKQSTPPMMKKMKKKMQERKPIVSNEVTERLKQFITDDLNGREAKVVIQKTLFASDLRKDQNRLNIPMKQLETEDFLTKNEKTELAEGKEMEVQMWGPTLQMYGKPLVLTIWHLKSTDNYVLKTNWHSFVMENEEHLKETTMIQVWSFRKDGQLCFAIASLDRVDGQNEDVAAVNI